MKTKRIISLLLALLMTLSLGVVASAANWVPVPTSPAGLTHGQLWFDFTGLLDSSWTPAQQAAVLNRYNAGTWYVDLGDDLVKVENADADLNGTYSRSDEPYITCLKEVDPDWHEVHKTMAGIQVGDYYIDKAAWYASAVPDFTAYYAAQYSAQHNNENPSAAQMQQIASKSLEIADTYYTNEFEYNPGGTIYLYKINSMPYPYVRYIVDYSIGELMGIIAQALNASIRQATASLVASSPWVRVATSLSNAAEGGYYVDFDDPTVFSAMNMSNPTAQEIAMVKSGEWYADFSRSVVCGKLTQNINGTDFSIWTEESADLFRFVKVRPVSSTEESAGEDSGESGNPQPQRPTIWRSIVSFFLRLVDFFKKIFGR